ncbi:MAG TPA: calcium-binding protein, partial [Tepidisphaeraceae bacterium]|nr:calcium-binding protein [Tepidisphaeraceae bacterium]
LSPGGFQNRGVVFRVPLDTFASTSNRVLTINGTSGNDVFTLGTSGSNITVNRNGIPLTYASSSIDRIDVLAGAGNDRLTTDDSFAKPIYAFGDEGKDTLTGGSGSDTLSGGAQADVLIGGGGEDRLNGNGGNDELQGGGGNDRLYGNDGNDLLVGGKGVDRLFGGVGDDLLRGGDSADKLYGETGNDTLFGDAGQDLLDGGLGTDTATRDNDDYTPISVEVLQ